jgi:succinyl-diaminopimelate desuccinylase
VGRNAIHRLGELITRVASYEPRTATLDGIDFVEQLQVVSVNGGVAANVVPDSATCTLNHRVAPDRTKDQAVSELMTFLGGLIEADDSFEVLDWAPSATPSLTNPHLVRLIELTGVEARGKVGWTDVATLSEIGVAATNFGAGDPLLAHRRDEFVTLGEVEGLFRVLGEWLK